MIITELVNYLYTLEHSLLWAVVILAIVIAPLVTRTRNRIVRISRVLSWIILGVIMGIWLANFALLPLPLRG